MATLAGKLITENGLGLMRLTWESYPISDDIAFAVLKAALHCGANVWNGADFYGTPESNTLHLMNRYFTKYPEDAKAVVLCIKSGVVSMMPPKLDGSPEYMRQKVDECNKILNGKKTIDIFGCARVDPSVPIETTMKALCELVDEGKIGGIQMSEVKAETIRRAAKVGKVDMVEAEVSLWATDIFSNGVAATCGELGIVVSAHTPLGAGMLTGKIQKLEDLPKNDHHRFFPRFQAENFEKNLRLVRELENLAKLKGCTTPQLALSWIKSFNGQFGQLVILPVAGASSEGRIFENCKTIKLDQNDLNEIKEVLARFPVVGGRYPAAIKLAEY